MRFESRKGQKKRKEKRFVTGKLIFLIIIIIIIIIIVNLSLFLFFYTSKMIVEYF